MDNSIYKPKYVYRRLRDIPFEDVESWGVKGIALDLDHTVFYDSSFIYISGAKQWISEAIKRNIPLVILTNAGLLRCPYLKRKYNIPYVNFANKPSPSGYKKAAELLGLKPSEMAFIGDRLLTDVMGANTVGAVSVYVEPPCPDAMFLLNIKRRARERKLFAEFEKDSESK